MLSSIDVDESMLKVGRREYILAQACLDPQKGEIQPLAMRGYSTLPGSFTQVYLNRSGTLLIGRENI